MTTRLGNVVCNTCIVSWAVWQVAPPCWNHVFDIDVIIIISQEIPPAVSQAVCVTRVQIIAFSPGRLSRLTMTFEPVLHIGFTLRLRCKTYCRNIETCISIPFRKMWGYVRFKIVSLFSLPQQPQQWLKPVTNRTNPNIPISFVIVTHDGDTRLVTVSYRKAQIAHFHLFQKFFNKSGTFYCQTTVKRG